jgi:hypothetical protein
MSKSARGTLLIIAAVFGVLQVLIPIEALIEGLRPNAYVPATQIRISRLLAIPVAVLGVLAALPFGNMKVSRYFSASAAGLAVFAMMLKISYGVVDGIQFGSPLGENIDDALRDFRYLVGFLPADNYQFYGEKSIRMLGTIAIILWILCAAYPAKKISAVTPGTNSVGTSTAMTPASPTPSQGAKFCTNCGKPLVGVAKFCAECGTPT